MVEDKASYYKGKANVRITNQSRWNMSTDNQIHPKDHRATKGPYEVRRICGSRITHQNPCKDNNIGNSSSLPEAIHMNGWVSFTTGAP